MKRPPGKYPMNVATRDLQLGDTIRLGDGAFMDAVVYNIEEDRVHLERPYLVVADFTYTGGVMVSIGHENWWIPRDSAVEYTVLQRRVLK